MQFLEWSIIGLRSARHVFAHRERGASVTLFPMIHVGEPGFYEDVYADAAAHDVVVLEGVDSRVGRRLTRAYRWIAAERLGLTVQPKFKRDGVQVVRADLPGVEFESIWNTAPRYERVLFEGGATLVGLWSRLVATRTMLGRNLSTTDLPDRDDVLVWSERRAPILDALCSARDAVLGHTVVDLLMQDDDPRSIAVIYGAGHMGALSRELFKAGFRPVESRWMTVFEP